MGVVDGVAVSVAGRAATTVGKAVKVSVGLGVELGVGLETVADTSATRDGVGLGTQLAMVPAMMANSKRAAATCPLRLLLGRCDWELVVLLGCNGLVLILGLELTFLHKSC